MIKLYRDITPNKGESSFFLYRDWNNYVAHFASYLQASIEKKNYKINQGTLMVYASLDTFDYKRITYIIDEQARKAYHVSNAVQRSGFTMFTLEEDFWGSSFGITTIKRMHITRVNRKMFGSPMPKLWQPHAKHADTPMFIGFNGQPEPMVVTARDINDFAVVLNIKYNGATDFIAGDIGSQSMVAIRLKDIYDAGVQDWAKHYGPGFVAQSVVSGIFQIKSTNIIQDKKCAVVGAWIVPNSAIGGAGQATYLRSKSVVFGDFNVHELLASELGGCSIDINYSLHTFPDYEYVAGVRSKGVLLDNNCNDDGYSNLITYRFTTTTGGMKVEVCVNDQKQDITEAFKLSIFSNENTSDLLQCIGQVIGLAMGATMAVKGFESGNDFATLMGVGKLTNRALDMMGAGKGIAGTQMGAGDALSNFTRYGLDGQLQNLNKFCDPFGIMRYTRHDNKGRDLTINGAECSITIEDVQQFAWIKNAQLGSDTHETRAFVKAEVKLEGCQGTAYATIERAFKEGIYVEDIDYVPEVEYEKEKAKAEKIKHQEIKAKESSEIKWR